ncbi:MAG TPA: wax ester/triacylglycerol synthase family O-acyltransferase [Candidatus Udaeobacter sp.]|nr:wax ester/triacylglycerol synthase family O-acyltransferase [Candidatus Udaeobacter sp.]
MAATRTETLTRADVAWLHADVPTNHFVISTLAMLDAPPDVERLKVMLTHRLPLHPRLRQVVAGGALPLAGARWVPAAHFDLDAHVHRVALPAPAGKAELARFIGDLTGLPVDLSRPMWHLYAVEGPGSGGALVGRFHHSLGDGQAMVRMLLTLTDDTPTGWKKPLRPARARRGARGAPTPGPIARLIGGVPHAPRLARDVLAGAGTIARLTLMDGDWPTRLRGELGLLKAVAWTEPIPLEDAKRIAGLSGTTINDVVVSAIAGGLGAYLRAHGHDVAGMRIRAMVPVNLRPAGDTSMTGNQFSLVFLELPVGIADPWERLMRVKLEMDRIKSSLEPVAGWILVQGLGFLPPAFEHAMAAFYADKATVVLTNVIGPKRPLYMAGAPLRQMTFWEPQSGGLGVGISIYSYAGELTVGVGSDKNLIAKPEQLTDAVMRAFAELVRQAR